MAGVGAYRILKTRYVRKIIIKRMAMPLMPGLNPVNSYAQMGQTLLFTSTSIAQEGHSFVFTTSSC